MNDFPDKTVAEVSKSQLKRDAQAVFELGRKLTELPAAKLLELPLAPDVVEAVVTARGIRSRVARKRQLGFLARLLRLTDTAPVMEALERMQGAARESNARHHRTEAWRDALLDQGDAALAVLAEACATADRQAIRQLVRNAQRERSRGKPPAAARKLFKQLRELDERESLPPIPG